MRICVRDLSGTGSKHDPLSVNYVVIGGLDLTRMCWCNHSAASLQNLSFTVWLLSFCFKSTDLNPCLDVFCPSFGVCKTYSAHEARCVCNENCPSYQDPVCTENGTSYDNECLYKLSFCKGIDNNTLYHPGSCEGKVIFLYEWALSTLNKVIWYYQLG